MEPNIEPVKAIPKARVISAGMEAELSLLEPRNGGAAASAQEMLSALEAIGVVYGIDNAVIDKLARSPQYNQPFVVAKGLAAVEGTPGRLEYKVNLSKDMRPKENPDGSVDYKDLGLIQNVRAGDVLCIRIPAGPGTPGRTVQGTETKPKPGREEALPMGKNTTISEDQLQLLAACDGQVDLVGNKLMVLNTFTVNGDVNNATGNIDFVGNLIIYGNVLSGFRIQAEGNITVNGSVEDATVIATGNIILKEGINGGGQGGQSIVQAGGFVKSKYIQNGTVKAGGDVESTFIQHSFIQSNTSVNVIGSKGRLAGGRVVARNTINTSFAGGRTSAISTFLEVGNDPAIIERHNELARQIENQTNQMNSLKPAINMLTGQEQAGSLSADRQEALNQARTTYQAMEENTQNLQTEITGLKEEMAALGYGSVNVRQSAYPGVHIVIGPEHLLLETQYNNTSFVRGAEGISFVPCTS